MKKNAQSLLEYILIFAAVAALSVAFVTKFDLIKIKNHVFDRPSSSTDASKISIEAMTDQPSLTTEADVTPEEGNAGTTGGPLIETTGLDGSISTGGNGTNSTTTQQQTNHSN